MYKSVFPNIHNCLYYSDEIYWMSTRTFLMFTGASFSRYARRHHCIIHVRRFRISHSGYRRRKRSLCDAIDALQQTHASDNTFYGRIIHAGWYFHLLADLIVVLVTWTLSASCMLFCRYTLRCSQLNRFFFLRSWFSMFCICFPCTEMHMFNYKL